jgi:plasmid stabilization system protein ParE
MKALGHDFGSSIKEAEKTIHTQPLAWSEYKPGVRKFLIRRFPYCIYYTVNDTEILILAVSHQHQRPGYWLDRIPTEDS